MTMLVAGTKAAETKVESINIDAMIDQAMKKVDAELDRLSVTTSGGSAAA